MKEKLIQGRVMIELVIAIVLVGILAVMAISRLSSDSKQPRNIEKQEHAAKAVVNTTNINSERSINAISTAEKVINGKIRTPSSF